MPAWYESPYTGLFSVLVRPTRRPHDPEVYVAAAQSPPWFVGEPELGGSGAGWTADDAEFACVGEAIERLLARALPCDDFIESSHARWPLKEAAIEPDRWVLFSEEQYQLEGFPFAALTEDTVCRWACCRRYPTGEPVWVPEEMVYLLPRHGACQRIVAGYSTGLSCGRHDNPVLLRGVQEVIERDALVGSWWGDYALEEWPPQDVRELLGDRVWRRIERPNLDYHFYRICSPFSEHVTMISVGGLDLEGWVFSVGSACRETFSESWRKALLEAIQGRHCVRRLLAEWNENGQPDITTPTTFFEHALYYAVNRQRIAETPLHRAASPIRKPDSQRREGLSDLQGRLGDDRPILFRNMTPPGLAAARFDWTVLRVVIPGLQPLHGNHWLPFLGGPLWQPRRWSDWGFILPHPFA